MADPSEEQRWIHQSQRGDHEAFAELVRQYQRMVHALTYRMTGSLSDSEDLAQETFVRAYRQLDGFRNESKFSSWLCRIAINASLNWKRRGQRRERANREWGEFQGNEPGTDQTWSGAALADEVQQALMKLPEKQRAAVVLTAYQGLNLGEAAKVLGCPEATVSWRIFAARARLKRLLKGYLHSSQHDERDATR